MAFTANYMQTTGVDDCLVAIVPFLVNFVLFIVAGIQLAIKLGFKITAEHDVRATTGHIGGNGHITRTTCLCNDMCFILVLFSIKCIVLDAFFIE